MATTKTNTTDSLKAEIQEMLEQAKKEAEKIVADAKAEAQTVKGNKTNSKETPEEKRYWHEKVPFYAIKDDDQYSDDIVVGWNGKFYKIQRGKQVMIPRGVYQIIMNSQNESAKLADKQAELETSYRDLADRFSR